MKKKHKKKSRKKAQVRIPFPVMLTNLLVLAAVLGLSYVWLCARCDTLGADIKRIEAAQRETNRRLINEQNCWANVRAPEKFQRALRRHGLVMSQPDECRIVRVRTGTGTPAMTLAYLNAEH